MTPTAAPPTASSAALVRIEGSDARTFLNGQFTCDLAALTAGHWTWGGYCTPKGRLLATFRIGLLDGAYLLQCPSGQGIDLAARLRRFVLRAKVTLTAESVAYRAGRADALDIAAPPLPGTLRADGERILWGLGPGTIAVDTPGAETGLPDWSADVALGAPWILPPNAEGFVPQMVDLDRAGGVSFSKGCYPGQEVVARARYLGEVKRHLFRIILPAGPEAAPGDAVMAEERAVGTILYGAGTAAGGKALAVIDGSSASGGALSVRGRPVLAVESVHADA